MKTSIIVAAFGALSLMTVGCKDKAETTNPDEAAAPVEEAAGDVEEAADEAADEAEEATDEAEEATEETAEEAAPEEAAE